MRVTYTSPVVHSTPMTIRCPLLIGRDDILELADRRLADVIAGRGQFILIAGEAGIGKTRLLNAIQAKAGGLGMPIVIGSIAPQDHDVPAASILDFARTMTWIEPFGDAGRALLELLDGTATTTATAEHIRRRRLVMGAVDVILDTFRRPTMLAFEDLQWADDLSLEIIGELARQSRDRPILLTADYRVEDVPPGTSLRDWRARLLTQRIAEEVRLQPLTRAETALVTTLILDTGLPAPREVSAAVYERTDGIPLHIEELLGALSAEARADGTAILRATVPDTLDDAILSRMAHRSPEAQAVARAGAVVGRCFAPEVLAGIMDVPTETLDEPIRELVDHMVLTAPGFDGGYFDFRHQLLRDVLYRTIPASDRRRFHARAAEFGAVLDGASEIHASVHYERAGLRREAFAAAMAGARDAAGLSAHREAFELYRRAVANTPDDLEPGDRAALLAAYAAEAAAIEENDVAEQANRAARAAYLGAGRPAKAVEMLVWVLNIWRREARSLESRTALLDELREELGSLPPDADHPAARAELVEESARLHLEMHALGLARVDVDQLLTLAVSDANPARRLTAATYDAAIDILDGRVNAGLDRVASIATEGREAGLEDVGITAYRDASTFAARWMEYALASRYVADGMRYADAIEQSHCRHVMGATSALVSWASGDWRQATAIGRQNIADDGCRRAATMARWPVGFVAFGRGELDDARADLSFALDVGLDNGSIELILPPMWGLAEAALLAGDPDLAVTSCRSALERSIALGERALIVPFVVTGVRAGQVAGRPEEAEAWLSACHAHLVGSTVVGTAARTALDHGRGLVALSAGSTGIARLALQAAVTGWDERGRIWEASWARLDLANCLTRINRFADAVALATDARTVASRLDSKPLADRADALLRMARGHVSEDEPWRPLTAREYAVARLISDGLTNAEIATELGIAPKTASSHVEHILAKLGASRRAEIAAWASRVEPVSAAR